MDSRIQSIFSRANFITIEYSISVYVSAMELVQHQAAECEISCHHNYVSVYTFFEKTRIILIFNSHFLSTDDKTCIMAYIYLEVLNGTFCNFKCNLRKPDQLNHAILGPFILIQSCFKKDM